MPWIPKKNLLSKSSSEPYFPGSSTIPYDKNAPLTRSTFLNQQSVPTFPGSLVLCQVSWDETQKPLIRQHPSVRKGKGWEGNARYVHHPLLYGNHHNTVSSSFQVRTVTGSRVCVSQNMSTLSTPQRLDTCRGLREVKWALGWLIQQSSLLDNNTTRPARERLWQIAQGGARECVFTC